MDFFNGVFNTGFQLVHDLRWDGRWWIVKMFILLY